AIDAADPIASALIAHYQTHGNWRLLASDGRLFSDLARTGDPREGPPGHRPPPRGGEKRPKKPRQSPKDPPRLTLLDANGEYVNGAPSHPGPVFRRVLKLDNQAIGFLVVPTDRRLAELGEGVEKRFVEDQAQSLYAIAGVALMVTVIMALLLARQFTAPINQLAGATKAVSQGDYAKRVSVSSGDELGQLQSNFNLMANKLEQSREARRQWVADISHELRTPLAILSGEVHALLDGVRKPDEKRLQSLVCEIDRLTDLVQDLHELSLADLGSLSYRFETMDIVKLVQESLTGIEATAQAKELQITANLPKRPIHIDGDYGRLRQLLANLLHNSLRYTHSPGQLACNVTEYEEGIALRIEDTAPSVDQAELDRMFERLYRAEASRSRATGGAGLGLAIASEIVKAHQGTIKASQSSLGGIAVEVRLPT
ncbi:MAG: ATP-binding protein, partial [Pseudomonadota bacterium]